MNRPRGAGWLRALCAAGVGVLWSGTLWAGGGQDAEAAAAREPAVLRIGTPNPVAAANIFGDYYLGIFAHLSNPPLMKMGSDGELDGLTAQGFEASQDNTVWTFTIRDDLYWSDGRKVTAEDVRFSIEYTGTHNPSARWITDTLQDSRVRGDREVVLTFSRPYTTLALEFATYNILPKHVWESIGEPMQVSMPGPNVGCGPFVIERIDLAAGIIRFERNPYWQGQRPKLDALEIHLYKNADVLSLALQKGDVDTYYAYASSYPYASIEPLRATGRFQFVEKPNLGLVFLGFNIREQPLSDRAFREALSYAIDYQEILDLDALGYGATPERGFVPPSMGGYQSSEPLAYDPAKSRELLAAAGYRDGNGDGWIEDREGGALELELLVRSEWARVGELLKDYLQRAGIRCELQARDMATWVAEKDRYAYDLTVTRTTPWGMMHAGWGTGYLDSRRTGQGVLHVLDDPEFLGLADEILSTADPQRLATLGRAVQAYYARELPVLALYWNMIVTPFGSAFTGWSPDPLYGIYNIDTMLSVQKRTE